MKSLGKLRKIFAVGVTVLMAVSLFAGCGDQFERITCYR